MKIEKPEGFSEANGEWWIQSPFSIFHYPLASLNPAGWTSSIAPGVSLSKVFVLYSALSRFKALRDVLRSCTAALHFSFSIFNSQFSILNFQFSIFNFQFSIFNSQFSILNSQFSIPHSPFPAVFFLSLAMSQEIRVNRRNWNACRKALEDRFERPIPVEFQSDGIDLEALMKHLTPASNDFIWRGRILIGLELRAAIASQLGMDPTELLPETPMTGLFPHHGRRQKWQELQEMLTWKLPRIGLPVWAQYIWGAVLLAGFVMMFLLPLWGLLVFFGGIILSFQVEKRATAFQYATLDETLSAMVRLNWPALELGEGGDDRLRLAFAQVLDAHFIALDDPQAVFPRVVVEDPFTQIHPQWHILQDDRLRETFDLAMVPGELVVIRECYVVGPLPENDRSWKARAEFIRTEYQASVEKYSEWVLKQLDRLQLAGEDAEFNLWFGDDLFCQVNLWFVVNRWVENGRKGHLFRVIPLESDGGNRWRGFDGIGESGISAAMIARIPFENEDIELACALWKAFKQQDRSTLTILAKTKSPCFRWLPEIVAAHWARFPENGGEGQPQAALRQILAEGKSTFEEIFQEFTRRQGIYGFTDLQVKSLMRELKQELT